VQDLSSKKEKLLAEYQPGWDPEKPERKWKMDFEVLEWGNQIIKSSIPTSVLIIDELGYLELEKKEGWVEAFKILDHGLYDSAVLVIRSELIDLALKHWQNATVISMENPSKLDDLFNQIEDSIAKK
jgi:nucleoside-triphosphatase THEP1